MLKQLLSLILLVSPLLAVHDFFAERNFICDLCKYLNTDATIYDFEETFNTFPLLRRFIPEDASVIQSENFCQKKGLCDFALLTQEAPNHAKLVESINSKNLSWKAEVSSRFENMTHAEIQGMMGTIVDPSFTTPSEALYEEGLNEKLPTEFDAREGFPECKDTIGHIRDQSNCGSCWAHGTTEAFNDRLCIKTKGQFKNLLSTADTTGCCGFLACASMGCNGGQIGTPWSWFKRVGVVSGGDFGDKDSCYPYTMPFCSHHVDGTPYKSCAEVQTVSPKCSKTCENNDVYGKNKQKASSSYGIRGVENIKQEIYKYGTVTAAFTVYEDFVNYKSGVYRHTEGKALGGHAIKLIGWGKDHWIAVNSWNETWGDNGTFRIAFGECGIDSQVHAGKA